MARVNRRALHCKSEKGSRWASPQRLIYPCWAISPLLSDPTVADCPILEQSGVRRSGFVQVEFECPMVKSLLIVDDDPAQRRILEETIKRLGFTTKTASSGEQALQILEGPDHSDVGLVLLDLVMDGVDGMGVLDKLNGKP